MVQVKKWFAKNKTKAWFALGFNLLFLIAVFLVMMPFYETNDDLTISEFINGSYAISDAHLVFQNYLLGLLYRLFYRLPGRLPWYAAFQYGFLWLSFSAVTYVLLRRLKSSAGYCIASIMLLYFAYEGYVKMQFSKVAGIAAAAGLLLLFHAAFERNTSRWEVISGWFLCCIGAMYRFDEFLACTALGTGIGVYQVLRLKKEFGGEERRRFLRCVWVFLAAAVLTLGVRFFDKYMYRSDPLWDYYDKYNDARYLLQDYGLPDYEENREFFEKYDINEDAYELYSGLNIYDPDKFTIEVMEGLAALRPERKLGLPMLRSFFSHFPLDFFRTPVFYGVLLMFLIWLAFGRHNGSAVLTVIYEVCLFFGLYFYLYYTGRYLVNRVDVGLWFAVFLVLAWLLDGEKLQISGQAAWIICLVVFLLDQSEWRYDWRVNSSNIDYVRMNERGVLEEAASDKEHLYLAKMDTISSGNSYGPFNRMAAGVLDNISWLGGWEVNTAGFLDTLGRYGVENPFRDMVGNAKVYLIDHDIDLTLRYIHAYYDETAEAVLVKELAGGYYKVYQVGGGE